MPRVGDIRIYLAAAILATGSLASAAPAAAGLAASADGVREGQVYDISPFSLTLRSERDARIVALRIVNGLGETQTIDVAPYAAAERMFEVELPVLVPHGYRLFWRLRDVSGMEGEGSVGFVVRGCKDERGRKAPPETSLPQSAAPKSPARTSP
jgi:hypothetical protein